MPLGMQGDKLLPGQQNIGGGGSRPRGPDRRCGDRPLDTAQHIVKTTADEFGDEFGALAVAGLLGIMRESLRPMGENVDQRAFELLRVGVAELGGSELLEVIVEEPGMIERGLQDQRFAARNRGAMAAMQRARGKVRACRHVGPILELFGPVAEAAPMRRPAWRVAPAGRLEAAPVRGTGRNLDWCEQLAEPLAEILPVVTAH